MPILSKVTKFFASVPTTVGSSAKKIAKKVGIVRNPSINLSHSGRCSCSNCCEYGNGLYSQLGPKSNWTSL